MAKVRSRILVIDASVARASGQTSMHPTSRYCREFLQNVLDICHRTVMTVPIREEWDKHQSRFARLWRLSMVARKKLSFIEITEQMSLEDRIIRATSDSFLRAMMEKDRHLIEAALASEHRVASLDDRIRVQFVTHGFELAEIQTICWLNPSLPEEEAVKWLRAGAPADRHRTLGFLLSSRET